MTNARRKKISKTNIRAGTWASTWCGPTYIQVAIVLVTLNEAVLSWHRGHGVVSHWEVEGEGWLEHIERVNGVWVHQPIWIEGRQSSLYTAT